MNRGSTEIVLFDFDEPRDVEEWEPINDTVMGGVSRSTLEAGGASTAVFAGTVSLENYGGFASVRSAVRDYDLRRCSGIRVRVKGDGKTYKLSLRADAAFDGVAHQAGFATQAETWIDVDLPFHDFVPSFHGRVLQDTPGVDPRRIRSFSLLIADKQEGPFRLEIDWIKAYCGGARKAAAKQSNHSAT